MHSVQLAIKTKHFPCAHRIRFEFTANLLKQYNEIEICHAMYVHFFLCASIPISTVIHIPHMHIQNIMSTHRARRMIVHKIPINVIITTFRPFLKRNKPNT